MKQQVGIWLDYHTAYLVYHHKNKEYREKVSSLVSDAKPRGGSGSATPYGPMDNVSESKYRERRMHQLKDYYQKILTHIKDAQEVYIFGPAEAKEGLEKELTSRHEFAGKVLAVEAADSMTENQIVAKVRDFFAWNV